MPNNSCGPGTTPYTIQHGDTFFLIARKENISVDALIKANPGVDPDRLFVGQIICIPKSSPPGPGPTHPCPTLRIGSRGRAVTDLQIRLRNAGFSPGTIDGIFGSRTQSAVIAFQRSENLVPDGIVGVNTWTALGVNCGVTPPPGCPSGTFPHTVKAGDTYWTLAQRYNTTVDAIMKANPTVDPSKLQIGQTICIPSSSTGSCPAGSFSYTIKSGDTIWNLAQRYNTTVEAIMKLNPTINPNNLQIGQVICIPN